MLNAKSRYTCLLLLALLIPFHSFAEQTAPKPLIFGFLPSRSPVTLFKHYSPLREYLNSQLKRTVVLETAADYSTFLQDTQNRKYDFVLTAPHFALLAIDSGKYDAAVTYTKSLMADILVPINSRITQLRQLAGEKISLPPNSAIISMAGKHYLERQGLSGTYAPRYVGTKSHNASIYAMLAGDTAAAIASVNVTRQFMQKKASIRKLATTDALPGMGILVARDLPEQIQLAFTRVLVQMKSTPEGKAALKKMGYTGYRKANKNEFIKARPYLKMYNGR